jgi:hypothetical protein
MVVDGKTSTPSDGQEGFSSKDGYKMRKLLGTLLSMEYERFLAALAYLCSREESLAGKQPKMPVHAHQSLHYFSFESMSTKANSKHHAMFYIACIDYFARAVF